MRRRQLLGLLFVLAGCGAVLVALASSLRPDTFFVGDPGVKLISARNALQFPAHPLNIPLPRIGNDAVPHVERFFDVHGDHTHAVTSEFFPLASAPFLMAFGIRGLYVLPALGFLLTLASTAWIAWTLDEQRDMPLAAGVAALGTPFLFYGLEFWEHMPAIGLVTCGAAVLLDAARRRPGLHSAVVPTLCAGLLFGAATTLRAEAACFVVAVCLASRMLVHRPSWQSLAIAGTGTVIALLPLEAYSVLHFGTWVPGHVGTNAALFEGHWLADRLSFAREWLMPSLWTGRGPAQAASFWSVAPTSIVAVAGCLRATEKRERAFLWTVALLTVLLTLLIAPNDGGGQWSPRYLLAAYVPLALLAADTLQELPRRAGTILLLALLVTAGVWVQRSAFRTLRGTKATYGRLADAVGRLSSPGQPLVTDAWWLDQLAAAALDQRNVLFAASADDGRDIVRRFSNLTMPSVTVVRSLDESADVDAWTAGTCYFIEAKEEVDVRGVVVYQLRHRCGHTEGIANR